MTREIKFRGRSIKTGEFVYGDLIHPWAEDEKHMMIRVHLDYHETKDGTAICGNIPVEKDSVAQLIAVDLNGREVYEGDPIVYDDGWRGPASFRQYSTIKEGFAALF